MMLMCHNPDGALRGVCELAGHFGNFLLWFDQRINVNEGVMALVALLVGVGMQNFEGARRMAGIGFLTVSIALAAVSIYEGGHRSVEGMPPFSVNLPPLFRNSHGDEHGVIVYDDIEENSVQLASGDKPKITVQKYLAANCLTRKPNPAARNAMKQTFLKHIADRDELNFADLTLSSGYSAPKGGSRDSCVFSWDDNKLSIDHFEIYAAIPSRAVWGIRYVHLHARIKKPTNVMIASDYDEMIHSLRASADIP